MSISVCSETDQAEQPERHQIRRRGLVQWYSVSSIPLDRWESLMHLAESSPQPLCQSAFVLVSYRCCNQRPYRGGLSNTNLLSHSSGGHRSEKSCLGWNQGASRAATFLEALGENLLQLLQAAGSYQPCQAELSGPIAPISSSVITSPSPTLTRLLPLF